MSWGVRLTVAGLSVLFTLNSVAGQDVEKCSYALVTNSSKGDYDLREALSIYSSVTEEDFNNAKKSFGAGADFFIGELPIKGNTTWDQFNEERRKRLSEYRYSQSRQNSRSWNDVYLAPGSPQAYQACLGALDRNELRVTVNKTRLAPDSLNVPINIRFETLKDDTAERTINLNEINGQLRMTAADGLRIKKFKGGLNLSAVFVRTSAQSDSILSLNILGSESTAQLVIPAKARIQKKKVEKRLVESAIVMTKDTPTHHQFKEQFCIPTKEEASSLDGFEVVPGTVVASVSYGGKGDASKLSEAIVGNSACGYFNIGTDGSATGVAATMKVRAEFQRTSWEDVD